MGKVSPGLADSVTLGGEGKPGSFGLGGYWNQRNGIMTVAYTAGTGPICQRRPIAPSCVACPSCGNRIWHQQTGKSKWEPCMYCNGEGSTSYCYKCKGKGVAFYPPSPSPGYAGGGGGGYGACDNCQGRGDVPFHVCSICLGTGKFPFWVEQVDLRTGDIRWLEWKREWGTWDEWKKERRKHPSDADING